MKPITEQEVLLLSTNEYIAYSKAEVEERAKLRSTLEALGLAYNFDDIEGK